MQPVARVQTLGLIELNFSYVVSRRVFRERLGTELLGLVLLAVGLIGIVGLRQRVLALLRADRVAICKKPFSRALRIIKQQIETDV